ncbi:MAG: SIR2 family protein [Bacteroidetes bacterium]|nr:SIR2 family protein [Bacteroidota bacterium]
MYQTIARKVKDGNCVLFLGPGAILVKDENQNWKPLTDLCGKFLAQKYKLELGSDETFELTYICSLLRTRGLSSDNMLQDDVSNFYKKYLDGSQFHPLLAQLTDLKFKIIINTTPDNIITYFLDEIATLYDTDCYNYYKPASNFSFSFDKTPKVLVYNLFGYYEKSESLVLTYKNQLAYIKKIVGEQQNERLPDALTNAFKDFRYHLFLGFDFEDWNLRLLLDTLYKNVRENIQPYAYPIKGERETGPDTRVFFQGEFSMQFPPVDLETFVNELIKQYKNLDQPNLTSNSEPARANALLLYNEGTDQDGADLLAKHLRSINLQVFTMKDAVGKGDLVQWALGMISQCQVILPLLSVDFFDENANPIAAILTDLIARHNPRQQLLVMPILLKAVNLSPNLENLDMLRPIDRVPLLGAGQELKYLPEIIDGLKRYVDKLPRK